MLHVTSVEIDLTDPVEPDDAATLMEALAPTYADLAGLRHKYFLLDPQRRVTGGVYVWDDAASAAAWHDAEWTQRVTDTYGQPPRLRSFDVPVEIEGGEIRNLLTHPGE